MVKKNFLNLPPLKKTQQNKYLGGGEGEKEQPTGIEYEQPNSHVSLWKGSLTFSIEGCLHKSSCKKFKASR